jgi:gas vesicle protein
MPILGQNVVPAPPKVVPTNPEFIGPPYPPASEPEKAKDQTSYQKEQPTKQDVSNAGTRPETEMARTPQEKEVSTTIDVIRDYDWTYSRNKISRADEIPYIEIKEFKLAGNSYITSLMTSALLFPDVMKDNLRTSGLDQAAKSFYDSIANFADNKFADFISINKENLIGKIAQNAKNIGSKMVDQVKGLDNTAASWNNEDLKSKYEYLYIRQPTGKTYRFPHFDNNFVNIGNDFNDSYQADTPWQQGLVNLSETVTKAANLINIASIAEPGMYIQRPQFYRFNDSTYTTSVDFYLFNTINPNSYLENLKLITQLVIRNTPHRFSRILVDPPCIYELTIPGRGFYPYSYISNLQVQHEGTKRILTNSEGKRAIIPDAFKVHIEFKSLTTEVNNFFIPEMGTSGINVSKRYGVGEVVKPLISEITKIFSGNKEENGKSESVQIEQKQKNDSGNNKNNEIETISPF